MFYQNRISVLSPSLSLYITGELCKLARPASLPSAPSPTTGSPHANRGRTWLDLKSAMPGAPKYAVPSHSFTLIFFRFWLPFLLPLLVAVSGCRFWLPFGRPDHPCGIILVDWGLDPARRRIRALTLLEQVLLIVHDSRFTVSWCFHNVSIADKKHNHHKSLRMETLRRWKHLWKHLWKHF